MEIALINEELFKENSPIKDDTIISKFVPYISIAQKMYIERILGRPLVEELKDQIKAASVTPAPDPNPISADNQALIVMLAPALSFYAVYQGIPFHWAAIVNKGITVRESENSKAVDIKDIAQLRRWLKDDAEELARDLRNYLTGCFGKYPLWAPTDGQGCEGKKESVPYDFGIFIPKRR
jgi:hypothetical protein